MLILIELVATLVQFALVMIGGYLIIGLWELACHIDAYEKGKSYEYRLVNLLDMIKWIYKKIEAE